MNITLIGISAALISTVSWALCSIIFKKLGERLEPIGMTTIKSIITTIILLFVVLFSKAAYNIDVYSIIMIALSGILGIAVGDSLFFASLNLISPLLLSLILLVGPDLFSGVLGFICLKETVSIVSFTGIILIFAGLARYMFPLNTEKSVQKTQFKGIVLALLSLVCMSVSMVIIKPVVANVSILVATMYRMFFSSLVLLCIGIFTKRIFVWKEVLKEKTYCLKLTGTMLLATAGGFLLSLLAIKYCKLIVASSLMSLEPFFILLFMILFCKYKPEMKEIQSIILIVLGIGLICIG